MYGTTEGGQKKLEGSMQEKIVRARMKSCVWCACLGRCEWKKEGY